MWLLSALRNARVIQKRSSWDRQQVIAYQKEQFRDLMCYVWKESPFYHELYSDHGIREADLTQLSPQDLPIITKEILMENFDRISKNPALRRDPIEAWIHAGSSPIYAKQFLILHTSGTSGTLGIFAYDKHAWGRMRGVTTRAGSARINPFNRVRLAYYGATHGRFAGVTSCRTLPKSLCRVQLCSILDPMATTIETLNDFQPENLFGYASGIQELALSALAGKLRIEPSFVTTSGEPLTDQAIATIEEAWGIKPTNAYGTSESICLGIQSPGLDHITLMEDENLIEILDKNDRPAAPGESGRMIITALYNRAIPVVRYDLHDYVTRGEREESERFDNILRVEGRANDALPITLRDGTTDKIHPVVLSEFFVPGARKFQFVANSATDVKIKYVSETDMDSQILEEFGRILTLKGAETATKTTAKRVAELPADQSTGKHRLVLLS
ncbi:MAG: phenylacetate-CoA ligase [Verrucomicrobiales bacterium]|jgi:phenylacetate-CoA ligase